MNDESKERLTKFIGECWHDCRDDIISNVCQKCGWHVGSQVRKNRNFNSWADFGALKDKLSHTPEWLDFKRFAHLNYGPDDYGDAEEFVDWLLNPMKFCKLVDQWLKERGTHRD